MKNWELQWLFISFYQWISIIVLAKEVFKGNLWNPPKSATVMVNPQSVMAQMPSLYKSRKELTHLCQFDIWAKAYFLIWYACYQKLDCVVVLKLVPCRGLHEQVWWSLNKDLTSINDAVSLQKTFSKRWWECFKDLIYCWTNVRNSWFLGVQLTDTMTLTNILPFDLWYKRWCTAGPENSKKDRKRVYESNSA